MIIPALDDPPPGLEELRRAVLLREHVGRVRTDWSETRSQQAPSREGHAAPGPSHDAMPTYDERDAGLLVRLTD